MKGFIYYEKEDAIRNVAFIEQLVDAARDFHIDLQLVTKDDRLKEPPDFVLFRGRDFKIAKSFEDAGIPVFNRPKVNRIANNKWTTFELGTLLGIPVIPSNKVTSADKIKTFPSVLKTVNGYGGSEVFLCENSSEANAVFKQFPERNFIVQPYVESNAEDVRVFILGNEILGAIKRRGNDSFKSNYTLGGSVEKYILSAEEEKHVHTIARALKSDYIGIDFLLLEQGGWVLNEIEDPVGARSLYTTHNLPLAQKLMGYIHNKMSKVKATKKDNLS